MIIEDLVRGPTPRPSHMSPLGPLLPCSQEDISMINSFTDMLSQVFGWLSIICVAGLAVVFSLLVLLFRLNNEDAEHGAKILKFIP
jgi:hypothetical protein